MGKKIIKKILVAVNGTKESEQAVKYSIVLAKQFEFEVRAIYVVDCATIKYLSNSKFFSSEESKGYEESLRVDGNHILEYAKALAKKKGVELITEIREGSVSSEIIKAAEENHCDMILMGGKKSDGKFVKQEQERNNNRFSIQSIVAENAPCSVLIVHKHDMDDLFRLL